MNSRYYSPEFGRFINADSLIDNTSLIGANQFAYCSNNPVNHKDPSGHIGIGALIGGLIGGISGAFSAVYNGDSIFAGVVTGAVSGAIMGLTAELCAEAAVIGALAYISCTVVCVATAGVFNIANQYWNYSLDKKTSEKSKGHVSNAYQNDELDNYPSFSDTVDKQSVYASMGSAALFAPLAVGANIAVGNITAGMSPGIEKFTVDFIANFATGGNLSILQSITETMLNLFE